MEAKSYNEADLPFFITANLVRLIQSFRYVGRDRRENETECQRMQTAILEYCFGCD